MSKFRLLATSAALLGASLGTQADTVNVSNRLDNPGFGSDIFTIGDPLENWIITSGSAVLRPANYTIDRDDLPGEDEAETFDNSFTTGNFLVLGDPSGKIGDDNGFGPSSIIQDFRTPAILGGKGVESLNLSLSFDYAFDGLANPGALSTTPADQFIVTLQRIRPSQSDPVVTLLSESLGVSNLGQIGGHFEQTLSLLPGFKYRLTFSLFEDDEEIAGLSLQAFNSAVGLDNVRVQGTASVAPLPPAAYLFASAVAAMALLGCRRPTLPA